MTTTATPTALRLKGSLFTISVVQLLSHDLEALAEQLATHIAQAPKFFMGAPMILDVQNLPELNVDALATITELFRKQYIIPIGVRGLQAITAEQAQLLGLAMFNSPREENAVAETTQATGAKPSLAPPKANLSHHTTNKLLVNPIRSGQQVYVKNGDLIVLAAVSQGAELIADGNIHVYGSLRGRALAGVNGNTEARIFCHQLEAELVSVAGHYFVRESLDIKEHVGPQQIYLNADNKLCIESVG